MIFASVLSLCLLSQFAQAHYFNRLEVQCDPPKDNFAPIDLLVGVTDPSKDQEDYISKITGIYNSDPNFPFNYQICKFYESESTNKFETYECQNKNVLCALEIFNDELNMRYTNVFLIPRGVYFNLEQANQYLTEEIPSQEKQFTVFSDGDDILYPGYMASYQAANIMSDSRETYDRQAMIKDTDDNLRFMNLLASAEIEVYETNRLRWEKASLDEEPCILAEIIAMPAGENGVYYAYQGALYAEQECQGGYKK